MGGVKNPTFLPIPCQNTRMRTSTKIVLGTLAVSFLLSAALVGNLVLT